MAAIDIKRGEALVLMMQLQQDDGTPADATGLTVTSKLRDGQFRLVAILPVVLLGAIGMMKLEVLDTSAWPLGTLLCDVAMLDGDEVVLSDTFTIGVQRGITVTDDVIDLAPFTGYPDSPAGLLPGALYWNGNLLARVPLA